ncbi:MAG TPA: alpha/beta hydrolase [Rhizomicrobium sp.]
MAEAEFEERRFPVGERISLYYRFYPGPGATGKKMGTPVLCLPGFWRNSRDYEDIAPYMAASRSVIAPDLRGRGRSDYAKSADQYAFDLLVDDMWRLLDVLGISRVVVFGTTLGGLMALEMAKLRLERIAGIIINDVGPEKAEAASKRMSGHGGSDEFSFEDAVARVRAQNEAFFPDLSHEGWARLMLRAYRKTDGGNYTRDFDQLTNVATAALRKERPTFWDAVRAARAIPTAVLRGEFSDYLTAEVAEKMKLENPDIVLAVVKGRGHPPLLDEPEVRLAVDQILARADAQI